MEPYACPSQTKGGPSQAREDSALWHQGDGLRERGTNAPHVMRGGSPYVQVEKALDTAKEAVGEAIAGAVALATPSLRSPVRGGTRSAPPRHAHGSTAACGQDPLLRAGDLRFVIVLLSQAVVSQGD